MLYTSKQKAELGLDTFLQSSRNQGVKKDEFKIHCLGEDLSISDYLAAVDRQIEDGKNVGCNLYCSRTVSNITSFPVAIDFMDWARENLTQIKTWMSFDELMKQYPGLAAEKKIVEVAPRYFLYNDARKEPNVSMTEDSKIILLQVFTRRELAEKARDWLEKNKYVVCKLSVHSIGEDFTPFEYSDGLIKALTDLPLTLRNRFDFPEKPDFWDVMRMPVIVDINVDSYAIEGVPTLRLKDLVLKFPEVYGEYLERPKIEHYKGYTILMHADPNTQTIGVACKGEFVSYEQVKNRDVCFQDFVGTQENVERRIKAWIDQQATIDEKNQRKAERKAQREEQAEANKPFKWFVPHKFVGYNVSGAIENDGTIVKKSSEEMNDFVAISAVIGNLWDALGNRRWFVNGDIVKFIKHANVPDTRMDGLFFPYDCFYVIFENSADPERRFMIRNRTIQYLRVVRVKSEQALKVVSAPDIAPLFAPDKCIISIVTETDSGKEVFEGAVFIDIADSSKIPEGVGSTEEKAMIQRIVVALLLLYSGRVEIFKKYTIPRSQRYELNKGIKDQHKDNNEVITMMPLKKLVVEDPKPSDGTGSKKKTHMRGWCLDTLRHPRYKRNPDGTLRTRIRPPCIINPPKE